MSNVNLGLTPWQQQVFEDTSRFKAVAAGRRCGKSHLAAVSLIVSALNGKPGKVFYVAPTQGMARDILWDKIYELANEIIEGSNINNLTITLAGGNVIHLKGADRPDTLRGVSLKHLVLDEYAFMKKDVWEAILRPALSDLKGSALFIGTPEGRNHFYDMFMGASHEWDNWAAWQFTSRDNPFLDPEEIDHAEKTLPRWAFNQEYMASFDALGSEYFDPEEFIYYDEVPKDKPGDYYIAVDLAGFETDRGAKTKRRDNSAMAIVFVDDNGVWWVEDIQFGRWTLDETAERIFKAVEKHRPPSVGIEKGIAQQAVMGPLSDLMRRTSRVFRVELLSHGNQKKQDRILWALQGRLENKQIRFKHADWNTAFVDEAAAFPSQLVHDDLLDALSYIDQLAIVPYNFGGEQEDDYEMLDAVAGY
jgi:predicted phage terminase large subunit-like protein